MNVLIPTADYPPIEGGISSVTLHLSRELAASGHGVTVVAPHFPDMETFDAAEPVTVVRFRGYGLGWCRFFPMLAAAWPRLRGVDLVLGMNVAYGGVLGLLGRRLKRVPYATFAYAYEFLKFSRTRLFARLLRKVYASAQVVVSISQFTRDQLAGGNLAHLPITARFHDRNCHFFESSHGLLGPVSLGETENRVEDNDDRDGNSVFIVAK